MIDRVLLYGVLYPVAAAAVLTVLAMMAGRRLPTSWAIALGIAGVAATAIRLVYLDRSGSWGIDHRIFWDVGVDIWSGIDPYTPARYPTHPILHPPSTYPFFALIASLPYRPSLVAWGVIHSALALALPWMASAALRAQGGSGQPSLTAPAMVALSVGFAMSDAVMATVQLGQISLIAAALLLLAVSAEGRGRPALAGVALGVATMKVGTMLPFLLLMLRGRDIRAWVALGATVAALVLVGGHAASLPQDVRAMLTHIEELSRPGRVNDISYRGPFNEWIFGFDHAAYRLGLRGRGALAAAQGVAVLALGAWLAREVVGRRVSRPLALALVSLYSVIFLYHRLYDAVMVAPALVFAVDRARLARGRTRVWLILSALSMFSVLYLRRQTLGHLTAWVASHDGVLATFVEAVILPCGTWGILLAMLCLRSAGDPLATPEGVVSTAISPD